MTMKPWPPPPENKTNWYEQSSLAVLAVIFCFPVGLALMWLYQKKWPTAVKVVVTGIFASFIVVVVVAGSSPTSQSASIQAPLAVVAPLTHAQKQQAAKAKQEEAVQARARAKYQRIADAKAAAQAKRQEKADERKQEAEAKQQEAEQKQQQEYSDTHYQNEGLTFDKKSLYWAEGDAGFGSYITGKVTNDSGSDMDYAEISFKEMDSEGNQVGTAMDNVTHLAAGATWKFKCAVLEDSTKHIEFGEMKSTAL